MSGTPTTALAYELNFHIIECSLLLYILYYKDIMDNKL